MRYDQQGEIHAGALEPRSLIMASPIMSRRAGKLWADILADEFDTPPPHLLNKANVTDEAALSPTTGSVSRHRP